LGAPVAYPRGLPASHGGDDDVSQDALPPSWIPYFHAPTTTSWKSCAPSPTNCNDCPLPAAAGSRTRHPDRRFPGVGGADAGPGVVCRQEQRNHSPKNRTVAKPSTNAGTAPGIGTAQSRGYLESGHPSRTNHSEDRFGRAKPRAPGPGPQTEAEGLSTCSAGKTRPRRAWRSRAGRPEGIEWTRRRLYTAPSGCLQVP